MPIAEVLKKYGIDTLVSADLRMANLSGADLSGADLSDANLRRANLRMANLSGADLSGADLSGANLRDANLRDANLCKADLNEVDLSDADLRTANLSGANLEVVDMCGVNLSGANLHNVWIGAQTQMHRQSNIIDAGVDIRGFRFWAWHDAKNTNGKVVYRAGCREWFSYSNAIAHYTKNTYRGHGYRLECIKRISVLRSLADRYHET